MLANIKKYWVEKYNSNIISRVDKTAPLKGNLSEHGYLIMENYFSRDELDLFGDVENSLSESKESKDVLREFPFLCKPLLDSKVVNIIQSYLGDQAVFDYASARKFLSSGPKSDTWHHDSVGHRIKIFLCLNDQDEFTHTQVIPNTHLNRYKSFLDSRISESMAMQHGMPLKVIGKKNDLIIFDTNLLHRGMYSEKARSIVQYEFSHRAKSKIKGHVGMRDCSFDKSLLNSPLILSSILKESQNFVYYP
jgi:hypothetical protein